MSTPLTLVVDRIEGDLAVVELDGRLLTWPLAALPPGVKEGSRVRAVLTLQESDPTAARERVERLARRTAGQGDDIDL